MNSPKPADKAGVLETVKAVAWSFFGVRRSQDHANDMARLNPIGVIVAGVLCAVVFVFVLLGVVRWVIA